MDLSAQISWLSGLDMDNMMLLHEVPEMNCLDDILPHKATSLGDDHYHEHHHSFSSSIDSTSNSNIAKQPTSDTNKLCLPVILNFGSASMSSNDNITKDQQQEYISPLKSQETKVEEQEFFYADQQGDDVIINNTSTRKSCQTPAKRKHNTSTKSSTQSLDHIMAERRRREKISERFIALSALVPGLKRMDKTSVLGDAIKYVKHLQERMKVLEEENARKRVESFILGKKSQSTPEEDNNSSSCTTKDFPPNGGREQLPEIEARLSDKTLLLKIQCQKRETVLVNILNAIERLHLLVNSVHATPFDDTTLDITIIAQMGKEMNLRPEHIVRDLSLVFANL